MLKGAIEALTEFHKAYGVPVNKKDYNGDDVTRCIRVIGEEAKEVDDALLMVAGAKDALEAFPDGLKPEKVKQIEEAALKELADLIYTCVDAAVTFGWNLDEAFQRVHTSNMSKLGADGKPIRSSYGKVLKGPNYKAPSLEGLV